jgi:RNA polymerase sigma-70 factor (sigma-E family)
MSSTRERMTDASARDTGAASELVAFIEQQHAPLVRLMSLYVGDRELAEDLAQEALARVCRDWAKVRKANAPEMWLRRVAFNLANSHFRRGASRRRAMERLEFAASRSSGSSDVDAAIAVRRAVAGLPGPARTALVLRYFDDCSVAEVAELMNCPEGTVKSLCSRAIASLRGAGLGDFEVDDE